MRFAIFGIPVRVDMTFLVIALLGNFRDVSLIAAWTLAAFIAVLAHELGHALTVRAFGAQNIAVTLFALGGVTTYPAEPRLSPLRQFVVSAAGSAVGIAIGGAAFLARRGGLLDGASDVVIVFASSLVWIGAVLGLLNWLPIRPLDGGQMLTSALELVTTRHRAEIIATWVSILVGALAAVLAFRLVSPFAGFFVILITLMGLRSGRPVRSQRRPGTPTSGPQGAGSGDAGAASQTPGDDVNDFPI